MRLIAPVALLFLVGSVSAVLAQAMSPMRGEITSYSDEFALKVFPRNVYDHRIAMEMRAYDQDFQPIQATIWPSQFWLAAQGKRPVTVIIPFGNESVRRVRVCAESVPVPGLRNQIRTQICGKFLARRVR